MTNKKSYMFYYDYLDTIMSELTKTEKWDLFEAVVLFERDGIETEFEDRTVRTAYKRMCADSKRNVAEYERKCELQRQRIMKRWNKTAEIPETVVTAEYHGIPRYTTDTDKDKDNDKEKVNDKVNEKVKEKDKEKGCGEKEKGKPYTDDELFCEFWERYPNKADKEEAKDYFYYKWRSSVDGYELLVTLDSDICNWEHSSTTVPTALSWLQENLRS